MTLPELLEQTRSHDRRARRAALLALCPCRVRSEVAAVWERMFEMASDEDESVRSIVLHNLCDGAPRHLEARVIATLEVFAGDPNRRIARRARQTLARYRRTGRIDEGR